MIELTTAEFKVAALYVNGFSAKRTARVLDCSYRTVEAHLRSIRFKINCTDRASISDYFIDNELFDDVNKLFIKIRIHKKQQVKLEKTPRYFPLGV